MDNELHKKLEEVARKYGKTEDMSCYLNTGEYCMYLNEKEHYLKFNHLADKKVAYQLVDDIIAAFLKCGYHPEFKGETQVTAMLFMYLITF